MGRNRKKNSVHYPYRLMMPALLVYSVFYMVPLLIGLVMSMTNWNIENLAFKGNFLNLDGLRFEGIKNYSSIFADRHFITALTNTVWFAMATTAAKLVLGLALAMALNARLKTKKYLRTIFYIPAVLSYIVVGVLFSSILRTDGMLNQFLSVVFFHKVSHDWLGNTSTAMWCIIGVEIWKWSGYVMTVFLAGLQGISQEYYESARIDGAGGFQIFRRITLPLLLPSFTVNVTMCVIGGFKVFDQVFVMTNGGPGFATQVLNTIIYKTFSEGRLAKSAAMGIVLFVFISIVSVGISMAMHRKERNLV
ncbi:carbohydrate ABC transporter permease [Diplocloster agilis]|uniref:carbohydrate ABC transporter permease n=1 Tax=Diplocloster agilis TaxID=2850323 RepID=UPI0008234F87|nr:sugar ABC transporter permease [Suonthocola fibrivorans]MCU6733011.1 sugar ABC transporter permease [Suonthocola fibrivorans]SCI72393.1 Inner membrane ABC transporter permease protein ycjO [uncultured Clostridium sp.]